MDSIHQGPQPGRDSFTMKMAIICLLGFGGFIAWAGFAPLEEGVAASGTIVVENNRQVVQHLEGGIIDTILIQEGSRVKAGDTLLVLRETASLANRDQISQQVAALRASVQRLTALQNGAGQPDFSIIDELEIPAEEHAKIIGRERDLFEQQRQASSADIGVLETRRVSALKTAELKDNEIAISRRSLSATETELTVISNMFAQQLVRKDQVTGLERSVASLEGDIARLQSEKVASEARAQDLSGQIAQLKAQAKEDIAGDLRTTYAELLAAEERLFAAQDVLNRSVIVAPVSGEVLNLAFATRGGVVRPGEPILELIPAIESVTASVRIRPVDRDSIFQGQSVRTQVSAYKSWLAPSLEGQIVGVSADLKTDIASGAQYYEARVRIPQTDLIASSGLNLIPGMPVEVFIYSGVSRTLVDYLFEPLGASLQRGLSSS